MNLSAVAFYLVAGITLVAAVGVVGAGSIVYAALLLILALVMTGLIYLLLLADFLALIQILVYGGTVSILLLFALMLTPPERKPNLNHRGWGYGVVGAVALFAVLMVGAIGDRWPTPVALTHISLSALGQALFLTWAVPFEIASVVLLVALLGALTIARSTTERASHAVEASADFRRPVQLSERDQLVGTAAQVSE